MQALKGGRFDILVSTAHSQWPALSSSSILCCLRCLFIPPQVSAVSIHFSCNHDVSLPLCSLVVCIHPFVLNGLPSLPIKLPGIQISSLVSAVIEPSSFTLCVAVSLCCVLTHMTLKGLFPNTWLVAGINDRTVNCVWNSCIWSAALVHKLQSSLSFVCPWWFNNCILVCHSHK